MTTLRQVRRRRTAAASADPPERQLENGASTITQTYRGLVMRVRVFEASLGSPWGTPWAYEVSIYARTGETPISGLLRAVNPYNSQLAAERAGVQRGQLAIDRLRGPLRS